MYLMPIMHLELLPRSLAPERGPATGQPPREETRAELLQAMPRGPGTGAGQGHQGSVSLGRGRVQDAEAETQSRALGVYGPAASEHSKCRAEGNVDAERVPRRGSGKTARRRGLCHDSYRPAGRGQEERVRPWEMRWPGKPPPCPAQLPPPSRTSTSAQVPLLPPAQEPAPSLPA